MKFLIKLIIVSFIGTVAMFGALGSENQWPGLIVAHCCMGMIYLFPFQTEAI